MASRFLMILVILLAECWFTNSGHILAIWTMPPVSPSLTFGFSALTRALKQRGHNVTLLTETVKGTRGFPKGTYSQTMTFKATYDMAEQEKILDTLSRVNQRGIRDLSDISSMFNSFLDVRNAGVRNCFDLIEDKTAMKALKDTEFDLIILFPFSGCDVLIANYIGKPFVSLVTSIRIFSMHEGTIGMPHPAAYVPFNMFGLLTDEMSFFQRIENLMGPPVFYAMNYIFNNPYEDPRLRTAFELPPDKNVRDLYSETVLYLSHTGVGTDFPRPLTPNFIPIGGLLACPGKPLPDELADFLDSSGDDGFILFTLGSATKGLFDEKMAESFAAVFGKLRQRVLWKQDTKKPGNIGDNTKITKWVPQNDVLAHPKIKLFIYHGGSNGIYEGVYHGVPMVVLPMGGDQMTHAARIQRKGIGLRLELNKMTEDEFLHAIKEVIQNPKYSEKAKHFSAIHKDAPMTPLETAVYWIEHVLKYGGDHLRPPSADMSIIKLYMVDVGVFLLVVLLTGLCIDYLVFRSFIRCCCSKMDNGKKETE